MSFLRRLLRARDSDGPQETAAADSPEPDDADDAEVDEAELDRGRALLAEERRRFDGLTERQLRYASHAWRPPAQGGERRADDPEEPAGSR